MTHCDIIQCFLSSHIQIKSVFIQFNSTEHPQRSTAKLFHRKPGSAKCCNNFRDQWLLIGSKKIEQKTGYKIISSETIWHMATQFDRTPVSARQCNNLTEYQLALSRKMIKKNKAVQNFNSSLASARLQHNSTEYRLTLGSGIIRQNPVSARQRNKWQNTG